MKRGSLFLLIFICCLSTILAQNSSDPTNSVSSYSSEATKPSEETIVCTRNEEGIICEGEQYYDHEGEDGPIPPSKPLFWVYLGLSLFLVCFAGICSGLTIGLMSLDPMTLEIVQKGGEPKDRKYAARILPIVKKHHLLLVTLLLSNAAAMETLPIFLDRISSPVIAILISVTMVLFFGEIIPQALCHRFGLAIGATLVPLVQFLMVLLFIIAYPISRVLDYLLGHGGLSLFKRNELKELVTLHGHEHSGPLSVDEMTIIRGALDLKHKKVSQFMTPLDKVFMLDIHSPMSEETLNVIRESGHSRIPVYSDKKTNLKGLLLVKSLLFVKTDASKTIGDLDLRELPNIDADHEAYEVLNMFQTGKSHIAAVKDIYGQVVGVVTLEDIIEELIQEEIYDEEDLAQQYEQAAREALTKYKMFRRGLSFSKGYPSLLHKIDEDALRCLTHSV
jgi:ankyrin repeat/SOCS box protein 13/metal transporter CNNM